MKQRGRVARAAAAAALDAPASVRFAAALVLFLAGAAGVVPPLLSRAAAADGSPPSSALLQCFSAGVCLSLALTHLLADAQELLGPLSTYPMSGAAATAGVLLALLADAVGGHDPAHGAGEARLGSPGKGSDDGGERGLEHAHAHAYRSPPSAARRLLTAHLFEGSVLLHSLIIGLDLGVLPGPPATVGALAAVLCVHQAAEGASLGGVLAGLGAAVSPGRKAVLAGAFAAATPLGVLAGVATGFSAAQQPMIAGWLNGITGGVLLAMAQSLVAVQINSPGLQRSTEHRAQALAALLAGAATMALLALWA